MSDSPQKPSDEPTKVDLGEDLLYENAPDEAPRASEPEGEEVLFAAESDSAEQMRNAAILLNEGFVEDAKRVLRKILIRDPSFVPARDKLDEIHELELKQILSERERTGYLDRRKKPEPWVSPDAVLRKLDEDLGLDLFPDRESEHEFARIAESSLSGTSPRDRMDIGIGFLEMGLPEAALPQFIAASQDPELRVPATSLIAAASIAAGRPLDAIVVLEPFINDSELERSRKTELLYMMGRAYEALGKREEALGWYRQVQGSERQYRDAEERARRLDPRKSRHE